MVGQMSLQTIQYASFVFISYGQAIASVGEGIAQSVKAVKEGIFGASEQIESPMFTTPCSEKKKAKLPFIEQTFEQVQRQHINNNIAQSGGNNAEPMEIE